ARTLRAALWHDAGETGHQPSGTIPSFMTDAQRSALALQRRLEDAILRHFGRSRGGGMQIPRDARGLLGLAKLRLPALQNQIPSAIAGALNDTMYRSRAALIEEMGRVFDRPTTYVTRSLRYLKANKTDLAFELWSEEFRGSMPPAEVLAA